MKKILALMTALMLMLTMAACSNDEAAYEEPESTGAAETIVEEEPAEPAEEAEEPADDTGKLSPEFKKTMDDYEAWFDHYCEVMKRYQENPSDLELLTEMSELLAEETAMFDQLESMDESDMNSAELAYYIEVTARIEKKLLEVADY